MSSCWLCLPVGYILLVTSCVCVCVCVCVLGEGAGREQHFGRDSLKRQIRSSCWLCHLAGCLVGYAFQLALSCCLCLFLDHVLLVMPSCWPCLVGYVFLLAMYCWLGLPVGQELTQAIDGGSPGKGAGRRINQVCASVEHSVTQVETQVTGQG